MRRAGHRILGSVVWLGIALGAPLGARCADSADCGVAYSLIAGNSPDLLMLQGGRVTLSAGRQLELGEAIGRNGSTALVFEVKGRVQGAMP